VPLEHILQAIEAEAQAEIDRITAEAEAQVRQILAKAEAEAVAIRRRHLDAVTPLIHTERARLLNDARLAALREVMQVREALIAEAFALARERLAEVRCQPEYLRILRRLAEEAIAELGQAGGGEPQASAQVILRIDPRDAALIEAILSNLPVPATAEPVLDCLGGLEVCTADGRIIVSNTFETRLDQARRRLRREIADLVAGGLTMPVHKPEAEEWPASTIMAMPA